MSAPHFRILILTLLLLSAHCFAGGSIAWTDVREKIGKEDAFLADYVSQQFEVERVGVAGRVGRDSDGNSTVPGIEVGTRVPPYEFDAKPKGALGDYTLHLTFEPFSTAGNKGAWQVTVRRKVAND